MKRIAFVLASVLVLILSGCTNNTNSSTSDFSDNSLPESSLVSKLSENYKIDVKSDKNGEPYLLTLTGFKNDMGEDIAFICNKNLDHFDLVIDKIGIKQFDRLGAEGYTDVNFDRLSPVDFSFTLNTAGGGAVTGISFSIIYDSANNMVLKESVLSGEDAGIMVSLTEEQALYIADLLTKACDLFSEFIYENNLI